MPTTIKIFGQHDFEIHEPVIGNLSDFQKSDANQLLARSALVHELGQAQGLDAAELALHRYVERAVWPIGRGDRSLGAPGAGGRTARHSLGADERGHRSLMLLVCHDTPLFVSGEVARVGIEPAAAACNEARCR